MKITYSAALRANLTVEPDDRVRQISHLKYAPVEARNPRSAAGEYLHRVAPTLGILPRQLERLHQRVSFVDPRPQDIEYQLHDVKRSFGSLTYCYYQTIHNVPVWDGGLTVEVKPNPLRVVSADHRGHPDLAVELPKPETIGRLKKALSGLGQRSDRRFAMGEADVAAAARPMREVLSAAHRPDGDRPWLDDAMLRRGRFFIYRYRAEDRVPKQEQRAGLGEAVEFQPTLPLPPVPDRIIDGRHYLVVELVFRLGKKPLDWKALVEVETGAILWLRAMTACVQGRIFPYDPKTATGVLGNTPDSTNATLNPLRVWQTLQNLNGPVAGTQSLAGTNVTLADDDAPTVAAPTEATGTDFDYNARTNNFAAVNAYHHADNIFAVIEDLGFTLSSYFDGTVFPVHVDHRASFLTADGIEVNAFCNGDAGGASGDGIGLVGYCLSDETGVADTTTNPLGRSVDKWVHWHEIGGHGILYDHVSGPNFGFAHSAGDSLAAFQNDPESQLRGVTQRFQYAPFRDWPAGSDRWFNRTVAAGWGFGGTEDTGGYKTEQIIATTLFRVYQAIGGDAAQVNKRWHASRVATYLVLQAVGKLMPGANANSATDLYNKLKDADADDWTSEGLAGGAYHKVIRWSFEKQGLFSGNPPAVDLYIDDGRGGEYQYQAVHWANQSVWNRVAADGVYGHEPGQAGVASHAYVRVKNRGSTDATGTVTLWHCLPGAGLTWPTDFVQIGTAMTTGNVQANNGNIAVVGPFTWTPNVNAYGHDCLIAVVETAQDPSNVSNFNTTDTIAEWRLVPHDNNVGQRNVQLGSGESGEAFAEALDGAFFLVGNPFNRTAHMTIEVTMPEVLEARGWSLGFAGLAAGGFRLEPGAKRRMDLQLTRGADFVADDVRATADRDITVHVLADGLIIGGMTYVVDPELKRRPKPQAKPCCDEAARRLLDCLGAPKGKVKKARVKTITVDVTMADDDDGCG